MKILLAIVGIILLLPIALVVVGLIATTLVGGYVVMVLKLFGEFVFIVLAVILAVRFIRKKL